MQRRRLLCGAVFGAAAFAIAACSSSDSPTGSVSLIGAPSEDRITFSGSYAEDGGTTTMHTLDIGPGTLSGHFNSITASSLRERSVARP